MEQMMKNLNNYETLQQQYVSGDYLQIGGRRYLVCDPTYINANIGQAMPQFKQTAANVIKTR